MTMKKRQEQAELPATATGSGPSDFPLGSVESRAAARAMLNSRGAREAKPYIYRASWVGHPRDEDFEILDINTGLPVSGRHDRHGRSAAALQRDEGLKDMAALPPSTTGGRG